MSAASSASSDASNPENEYASQCLILAEDVRKYIPAFNEMSSKDFDFYNQDQTINASALGFAYAAWNEYFPSMVKIGATRKSSPYMRLKELSGTGVPGKFELVACIQTSTPFQVEKIIHNHFNEHRTFGKRKEFFEVDRDEVVAYFNQLATSLHSDEPLPSGQSKKRKASAQPASTEETQKLQSRLNEVYDLNAQLCESSDEYRKAVAKLEKRHELQILQLETDKKRTEMVNEVRGKLFDLLGSVTACFKDDNVFLKETLCTTLNVMTCIVPNHAKENAAIATLQAENAEMKTMLKAIMDRQGLQP